MKPFTSELHLHIGGCLSAEDLWTLGKDRWKKKLDRLHWYESEYEKAWGRRPNAANYWLDSANGFELLKKDYQFLNAAPFNKFQACFNLIIALFEITPEDHQIELLLAVLNQHRQQGLKYVEYRVAIPADMSKTDIKGYLNSQCQEILKFNQESAGEFEARLAYSIPRPNDLCKMRYGQIRQWMNQNPTLAQAICGVDFSYFEEDYPPSEKIDFFKELLADNKKTPQSALAILYHVGESFQSLSIESAARWVWQAHDAGAHRLGHAIALGINPASRATEGPSTFYEKSKDRAEHLSWLLNNQHWLKEQGYHFSSNEAKSELDKLSQSPLDEKIALDYNSLERQEHCRSLQTALMNDLAAKGAVIESCPSSNARIGMIQDPSHHPIKKFLQHKMNVVISTDDPGIFDIDLASEVELCRKQINISASDMATIQQNSEKFRSLFLANT